LWCDCYDENQVYHEQIFFCVRADPSHTSTPLTSWEVKPNEIPSLRTIEPIDMVETRLQSVFEVVDLIYKNRMADFRMMKDFPSC
jgi:hypothetical protein